MGRYYHSTTLALAELTMRVAVRLRCVTVYGVGRGVVSEKEKMEELYEGRREETEEGGEECD